jgi:predicted amidohydrolase
MQMPVMIAQVPAVWDVDANLATLREVLGETRPGDVVVLPEGLLSGYGEDLAPLDATDPAAVDHAVAQAAGLAKQKQVHIFCGSLRPVPSDASAGVCARPREWSERRLVVVRPGR